MLKSIVALIILILTQSGCSVFGGYTDEIYRPAGPPPENMRQELEGLKREFLQIEDLKIGTGPLAAHGRKVTAQIAVRYSNGTLAYRGPMLTYFGIRGATFIHNSLRVRGYARPLSIIVCAYAGCSV